MMDTFYTRWIGRNLTGPRTIDVNKAVQYSVGQQHETRQ